MFYFIEKKQIQHDRRQSPSDEGITLASHTYTSSKDNNVSERNQIKKNVRQRSCQKKILMFFLLIIFSTVPYQ